jgi:HSP20 family molecular chaperone IbpA
MWISTQSPWSSLSLLPHLMNSSFTSPRFASSSRSIRSKRRYQLTQDDHAFTLQLDIPGIHLDDLAVEVKDQTLHITLSSPATNSPKEPTPHDEQTSKGYWIFNELNSKTTSYQFDLSSSIQIDQIQAQLKNGQLFLTLPKSEPSVYPIHIQQGA